MALNPQAAANMAANLVAEEVELARQRALNLEMGKFRAASWDRAATGFITGGFLSPLVSYVVGTKTWVLNDYVEMGFAIGICLICAMFLNFNGRDILEETFK
ncbi:hypothetical protein P3C58_18880 [Mesorhizobium sp. XAP10]|uniref:hypothetical protein n=1 Tax=unclassified Mesorhizobium TaxID=325217 RepID=UPI0023DEA7CD|nr:MULTISPECIES: hypothetical protein [unclassified Mesorhizobium]MDF3154047.1 hypothetical protein [Mesorhizobium sp. XAP10]MDF3247184.1 hypothetical protein [Mesorhizobium sp. XAP4]